MPELCAPLRRVGRVTGVEPVELRGARVVLSVTVESDAEAIYAACQDPDIPRYTTVPSPYRRRDAEEFIGTVATAWTQGTDRSWAIRHAEQLIGIVGLYRVGNGAAELGYWMAKPARGQGLLSEAGRAVLDWGFAADGLGLQRIEWRAVVGNTASARSAQRLGFRYEGLLRLGLYSHRGRDDGWIAGLLATDDRSPQPWPPLQERTAGDA